MNGLCVRRIILSFRIKLTSLTNLLIRFKGFIYALKANGGFRRLFNKAIRVIQRDGITGIKIQTSEFLERINDPEKYAKKHLVDRNDYVKWIEKFDCLTHDDLNQLKNNMAEFLCQPKISIIMPTYNSNIKWLSEAIQSVQNQIYTNWELCIADDASSDVNVRKLLSSFMVQDNRIKVVFREQNGHISVASNSALAIATGEWVGLLDHDDLLTKDALYHVVKCINDKDDVALIYSDEDKVTEEGVRTNPYFKPDWNYDLFLSHNLICHFSVYKRDMLRVIGGFRVGYEGAQDYDLALRCVEMLQSHQIQHIPKILYHWRACAGSTALANNEKNYAVDAGEKALDDYFVNNNIKATAEKLPFGMYRTHYKLPENIPLVSLIIPTYNAFELVKQCVNSILNKTSYQNFEIIIVDNNSDDETSIQYFREVESNPKIRVIEYNKPFNYSAINNFAVSHAKGDFVVLVNNDIEVISENWLTEMLSIGLQPNIGAVGARLFYPNNTIQHAGVIVGLGGVAGHAYKDFTRDDYGYFGRAQLTQSLSAVTAACLLIKKSVYEEVNGLDEENLKIAFNDVDFCLKVRDAGYRNVWTPYAELYHHESATRGYEDTPEKQARFSSEVIFMQTKWGDLLFKDPAYNPNLTLEHGDFSLAWPPR